MYYFLFIAVESQSTAQNETMRTTERMEQWRDDWIHSYSCFSYGEKIQIECRTLFFERSARSRVSRVSGRVRVSQSVVGVFWRRGRRVNSLYL